MQGNYKNCYWIGLNFIFNYCFQNKYATQIKIKKLVANSFAQAGSWGNFAYELVLTFTLGVVPQNRAVHVPEVDAILFDSCDVAGSWWLTVMPCGVVERLHGLAPVEFSLKGKITATYPHSVRNGGTCVI